MKKGLIRKIWLGAMLCILCFMTLGYGAEAADNYDGVVYISTPEDMDKLMNGNENTTFKLTCDIDMSKYKNANSALGNCWTPVNAFKGNIDGQGFAIKNLKVVNSQYAGLIASNALETTITDLHISHAYLQGNSHGGGMIAEVCAPVTIKNCSVSGSVKARKAGGFVGGNVRTSAVVTITESINMAQVQGSVYSGGIAGYLHSGTIADCINMGNTDGNAITEDYSASIYRCYNIGTSFEGEGLDMGGYFVDSCYTNRVNPSGAQRYLSDVLMKKQDSFAGFNFEETWAIDSSINNGYPYLQALDTSVFNPVTHDLGEWEVKITATCKNTGVEVRTCRFCGVEVESREVPLQAHTFEKWRITKSATCTEKGERYKVCSVCDAEYEMEEFPATGHIAGSKWYVTKAATSRATGSREQRCEQCKIAVVVEEIPMIYVAATGINLNQTKATLTVGSVMQLSAQVTPSDVSYPTVSWSSSDVAVATVDGNGLVTVCGYGSAYITATATDGSGVAVQCYVEVPAQITYKLNGGTNNTKNVSSYVPGNSAKLYTPKRAGYTFKGWYTTKKFSSKSKVTTISKNTKNAVTLYAKWEKVKKPAKVAMKSVKNSKTGTVAVTAKKGKSVSGYEFIVATDKKFKKNTKTVTTSKTTATVSGLQKGTTYYVKVRTYKLDSANKKVYGKYSSVKSVKVKK